MRFALTLPATLHAPYEARQWVTELGMPLAADRADAVRLLITELVAVSVKHAGLRPDQEIEVALAAEQGVVRVEVTDPAAVRPSVPDKVDEVTDWGFYLVDKFADRWGLADSPKPARLWFELDVYNLPAEPADYSLPERVDPSGPAPALT
jgi:anti-sigma regulatory factor (Ser/Thr protein kinase)